MGRDNLQFISFDSVVGNALYILYHHNIKVVSFETLVKYAKKIVAKLEKHSNIRYGLLFSRKYQMSCVQNNADFIQAEFFDDGNSRFSLKDSLTIHDIMLLECRFRWTMAIPFIEAFYDDECVNVLLV